MAGIQITGRSTQASTFLDLPASSDGENKSESDNEATPPSLQPVRKKQKISTNQKNADREGPTCSGTGNSNSSSSSSSRLPSMTTVNEKKNGKTIINNFYF